MHRRRLEPVSPPSLPQIPFSRLSHVSRLKELINNLPLQPNRRTDDRPKSFANSRSYTVDCLCTPKKVPKLRTNTKMKSSQKNTKKQPMQTLLTIDTKQTAFRSVDWWGETQNHRKLHPCHMISFTPFISGHGEVVTSKPFSLAPLRIPQPQNEYLRRGSVSPTSQPQNEYSGRGSVSPTVSLLPETFRPYIKSPELATGNARTSASVLSRIQTDFARFPHFVQTI